MTIENLPSRNMKAPEGESRKIKKGMTSVRYIGNQPEVYFQAHGVAWTLIKNKPKDIPSDVAENLCKQINFEEVK